MDRMVKPYSDPYIKKDQLWKCWQVMSRDWAVFRADVPNGRYYVKELQPAPDNWKIRNVYEFDASYTGEQEIRYFCLSRKCLTRLLGSR